VRIEVRPVTSRRERQIFLTFPWRIYKNDPLWVPPLLPQRASRLDPAKNPVISGGAVQPFIAWRGDEPVGTIVGAVDAERNATWGENNAIFGLFECIEDYSVAEALFDTVVAWARQQGKPRLWGPWPLDYEDSHGFLVKGWDRRPVVMCAHNPPYYPEFAEQYGMKKARRDSLAFAYDTATHDPAEAMPEKLQRVAEKVRQRGRITIRPADFDRWDEEIEVALDVLNRGLAVLGETRGFWSAARLSALGKALRPVLDPELILFAEVDGKTVGWVMGLPDLNEAIAAANGLRYPWNAVQFWLALRRRPAGVSMKSIAVDPDYWNRGIDALLIYDFSRNALEKGFKWGDFSLTGEDNPMTPRIVTHLGGHEYKRYRIYDLTGLI
jgi:GNAT superfamily N-acetyltransferase